MTRSSPYILATQNARRHVVCIRRFPSLSSTRQIFCYKACMCSDWSNDVHNTGKAKRAMHTLTNHPAPFQMTDIRLFHRFTFIDHQRSMLVKVHSVIQQTTSSEDLCSLSPERGLIILTARFTVSLWELPVRHDLAIILSVHLCVAYSRQNYRISRLWKVRFSWLIRFEDSYYCFTWTVTAPAKTVSTWIRPKANTPYFSQLGVS